MAQGEEREWHERSGTCGSPAALCAAAAREGIARAQGRDGVTWLGHATFLIRLDGVTILTDPYLTAHASPLPPERLPPVDLVLLSHNHYEHLDLRTLAVLSRTQRPVLVTTLGVSRHVDHAEFSRVLELDWHQGIALLGIELRALPAIHFSRRTPFDRNRSLWCGFRVAGARHALVFAGDTAFGPVHREIGERYPPVDVALVPIGAYAPRLLMQGAHCTPEEGFRIGQDLRARCICAMHWGTIRLTDEPPFEPPLRFRAAAAAAGYGPDRAWLPAVGETRLL
jgi:N-acyl-phosphatidylethanolamine-hydrolysing phospholipase D